MPAPAIAQPPQKSASPADLWWAIEVSVREVCVLRAERREPEAVAVLQGDLPKLIANWSRTVGLPGPTCQQHLRDLFSRVQREVATAAVCKRLVLQSINPARGYRGLPSDQIHIQRRVRITDIPDMLDALEEGERSAAFRRQHLPSAEHRMIPAGAWN